MAIGQPNSVIKRFKTPTFGLWGFVVSSFFFFALFPAAFAQAPIETLTYNAPNVFVASMRVRDIRENKISGEFEIWNAENFYINDLSYEITLLKIRSIGSSDALPEVIDKQSSSGSFPITPNSKIARTFSYEYPRTIPSDNYLLRAELKTNKGVFLSWKETLVSLEGTGKFLTIDSSSRALFVGGRKLQGSVSPADTLTLSFSVHNPGTPISVTPKIKIFKGQTNTPPLKTYSDREVLVASRETKRMSFEIPLLEMPDVYFAEIQLYENNDAVSSPQQFLWTVNGIGGKILLIKTDKDSYIKGEEMIIAIEHTGPADMSNGGMGQLDVLLYSNRGMLLAHALSDVSLAPEIVLSEIKIKIGENITSPRVEASLLKNGKVLDSSSLEVPAYSKEAREVAGQQESLLWKKISSDKKTISIALMVILTTIGFILYRLKLAGKLHILLFAVMISAAGILPAQNARSSHGDWGYTFNSYTISSGTTPSVTLNNPLPFNDPHNLSGFLEGDTITFSGRVTIGGYYTYYNYCWYYWGCYNYNSYSSPSAKLTFSVQDNSGTWVVLGNWNKSGSGDINTEFNEMFTVPKNIAGETAVKVDYTLTSDTAVTNSIQRKVIFGLCPVHTTGDVSLTKPCFIKGSLLQHRDGNITINGAKEITLKQNARFEVLDGSMHIENTTITLEANSVLGLKEGKGSITTGNNASIIMGEGAQIIKIK